jgi:hypothetical protein
VDIRGSNDNAVDALLDIHYPMQMMRLLFLEFTVPGEMQQFRPVPGDKSTAQHNDPGGVFVTNSVTGLTDLPACIGGGDAHHCQRPSTNTAPHSGQMLGLRSLCGVL